MTVGSYEKIAPTGVGAKHKEFANQRATDTSANADPAGTVQ
jgi:hypothetical protein